MQSEGTTFLENALNLTLLCYRPELLRQLDHFDRKIICVLMESSSSAIAIAKKTRLNRKTARMRLKKLKRIGIVAERPSRNSMFSLSEEFLKALTKGAKVTLEQ